MISLRACSVILLVFTSARNAKTVDTLMLFFRTILAGSTMANDFAFLEPTAYGWSMCRDLTLIIDVKNVNMLNIRGVCNSSVKSKPVQNKPRSRKHKMRPVLQLIPHCSYILQMLFSKNQNKKVNVNEIDRHLYQIGKDTKQTGLRYKLNTLDAIKLMQKAGIITKSKDSNHTQTEFIELEPLGREFGQLLESRNNFHIAYSQLREKIKDNFNLSKRNHEKVRENLLRIKGWTDEEISSYEKTSDDVITFETNLLPLMVQGLVNRYPIQI
jgi:hypothetical protein